MNIVKIEALSIPEAWWKCIKECMDNGHVYTIDKGSFVGQKRLEFDLVVIQITNPNVRPLVPEVPLGVPIPTNMEYVENYLPYLMTSTKSDKEVYTYGSYIEPQLDEVIKMLKEKPNTNQSYITVGDPSTIKMDDPPCLRGIQARVRYGKLHFILYFRSWDLFYGFPSNLAAIQLMKEYMASEIGVEDGELLCISGGLHLYDHCWDFAKMVLGRS